VYNDASSSRIMRRLTTLFPSESLEEHAEELGVVEREGKLQVPVLVWALVFGFAAGESRTLAGFRRIIVDYFRMTPTRGSTDTGKSLQ